MKKCVLSLIVLGLYFLAWGLQSPKSMIVKTRQPVQIRGKSLGLAETDEFLQSLAVESVKPVSMKPGNRLFTVTLGIEPDWQTLKQGVKNLPGIEYIEPNYLRKMHLLPNDPLFPNQQFDLVHFPEAWDVTTGSEEIVLAVIDSGMLFDHPDLQTNIFVNTGEIPDNGIDDDENGYIDDVRGYDFADAPELAETALGDYLGIDNDPTDETYHGTHVTGIIAADNNNRQGICGGLYNVRILVVRAGFSTTQGQGYLQDDDCASAIMYAADMGAKVINMSWGDPNYSQVIADACQYAFERGCILVASAGNDYVPYCSYPARLSTTISVGAVDSNGNLANFSSYGIGLDIMAPGQNIISTYSTEEGNLYYAQSGTSMSSPMVSSAVALLLSQSPGLTFQDVRARLLGTAQDLGDPGYDEEFGYGLLDVEALLRDESNPVLHITYPSDQLGLSQAFDIRGTVESPDFFRYTVMYAEDNNDVTGVWYDVETHSQVPTFHFDPVSDGVIAHFTIPEGFPEKRYRLRVQFDTIHGERYDTSVTFRYDNSAPVLRPQSVGVMKRYSGEYPVYYVQAAFDEDVIGTVDIYSGTSLVASAISDYADSIHILRIPDTVSEGSYSYQIRATNVCGISFASDMYDNALTIERRTIPVNTYSRSFWGGALVPVKIKNERRLIAMNLDEGYGNVRILGIEDAQLDVLHSYPVVDKFRPLATGYTNDTGVELLSQKNDTVTHYETPNAAENNYPTLPIWTRKDMQGGVFGDYDRDGKDEVILVKTVSTGRILVCYDRTGMTVAKTDSILNPSTTTLRNTFVPALFVEDFDSNGLPDIFCADTDGDVMVFTKPTSTTHYTLWQHRMPVPNTYYLGTGDFDGNGTRDLAVGGYRTNNTDFNKSYWYFEFFTWNATTQSFASMGEIAFDQVETENSISCADLDGDGDDEIALALTPNCFVLDYIDGDFVPVWKGDAQRTFSMVTFPKTDTEPALIFVNAETNGMLMNCIITPGDPFTGPAAPSNFKARPLGPDSVLLTWSHPEAAQFRVWRKIGNTAPALLATTSEMTYVDTDLETGESYEYYVVTYDTDYSPSESMPTLSKTAIPMPVPRLTGQKIFMQAPDRIVLNFDQRLDTGSTALGNFEGFAANVYYSEDATGIFLPIGNPVSAAFCNEEKSIVLRFGQSINSYLDQFESADSIVLRMAVRNVSGYTGVGFPDNTYSFRHRPDTECPWLDRVTTVSSHVIRAWFSEPVITAEAGNIDRYSLVLPSIDTKNAITSVTWNAEEQYAEITLRKAMEYSSQSYVLYVRDVHDLTGNNILNDRNCLKFSLTTIHDLSHMVVYPNPLYTKEFSRVYFEVLPFGKEAELSIYSQSGDLVYQDTIGPFSENNYRFAWDAVNSMRKPVSSGMYFYVMKMDNEYKRGTIAVIR